MKSFLTVMALVVSTQSFANCYQALGTVPAHIPQKICIEKELKNKTIVLVSDELGRVELPTTKTLYMTAEQYYILSEGEIYDGSEYESCGRQQIVQARFSGFVENNQLRPVASILELTESFVRDTCHGRTEYTNYKYEQI